MSRYSHCYPTQYNHEYIQIRVFIYATFYPFDVKIRPNEHKILLTEPPQNPVKNREKIIEKMFETYQFAAANVSIQAMLTLYAQVSFVAFILIWFSYVVVIVVVIIVVLVVVKVVVAVVVLVVVLVVLLILLLLLVVVVVVVVVIVVIVVVVVGW